MRQQTRPRNSYPLRQKQIFFLVLTFLFQSSFLLAQGWEKSYPIAGYENARTEYFTLTQDGGYCLTATVNDPSDRDIAVLKLDAEGNQQWLRIFGEEMFDQSARIFQLEDGGYIIGGMTNNNSVGGIDYLLLRLDALGNEIWRNNYGSSADEEFNALTIAHDGGFLLMGELPPFYNKILLIKVTDDGTQEWIKSVGPNVGKSEGRDIKPTSDGGYIITGYSKRLGVDDDEDFYILKIDAEGNEIWNFETGSQFNEFAEEVVETQDGGFVSTGYKMFDDEIEGDLYMIKVSATGDSLWAKTFGSVGTWERGFTLTEATNGDLIAVGNSTLNIFNTGFGFIVRTDSDGNELWTRYLTEGNAVGYPANILPLPNDGFAIAGTGDSIVGMMRTDVDLQTYTALVNGNIFHDSNDDCTFNASEAALDNWIVLAQGNETFFALTDEFGNYAISLDTGNYELHVVAPNELWQTCTDFEAYPLVISDSFDTLQVSVPVQSEVDCPHMVVDISAPALRRCFENTYYIQYCNDGTLDESNAYVEILFDEYLTVNSASLPFTDLGDQLFSFEVGEVGVGECGEFTVRVLVDCDSTVLGQTHCVNAHIFPDSFCLIPSVEWDSSSIAVSGQCVGDSVVFEFENVGTAVMSEPSVVKIVEDDVIIQIIILNLNPGETFDIPFQSDGSTLRADAVQSAGHPGNSHPTATVEGCGASQGNLSLGFVTQYPMDDGNHFIDIDCQENVGAYDPNDKLAFPKGISTQHYIEATDEIEYHIRFQNTGTDTAINVVLRDTLSEFLDPATIRTGASSHNYDFELLDNGILKFSFLNIMLPDSNANLEASNGFVKFKIKQHPNNLPATLILNRAAIYFDFNAPVITEEVYHIIAVPKVYEVSQLEICRGESWNELKPDNDTLIVETIPFTYYDSVQLTGITILELNQAVDSVVLELGEIYWGEMYEADTIVILQKSAEIGCDTLVTVSISVNAVNTKNPFANEASFDFHPNPTNGTFFIEYELQKKEQVTIELYNALGQKIRDVVFNEIQNSGKHGYEIRLNNKYKDLIFVRLLVGDKEITRRVVILK